MKRIMIIGCGGAGKSTLSYRLHEILDLPIYHLDQIYWKPGWIESERSDWIAAADEVAAYPEWIIDGNYGSTMDTRISRADTIIYLDISTLKCLYRVTKRIWQYKGKSRPDMTDGCPERFDLEFYHYILTYNMTRRKGIMSKISAVKNQKRVYILKNNLEVENFLDSLKNSLIAKPETAF